MTAQEIEQKQVIRFKLLGICYDKAAPFKIMEEAYQFGIKNGKLQAAINFLTEEKLIAFQTGSGTVAEITHAGIKLYEYIVTRPDERTELFPSLNDMGL